MLKKSITYTDFNGQPVTEDHFFHLSAADLIELEMSETGGYSAVLQKIIDSQDGKTIMSEFKKLIMLSYGVKSEDGKRFIKNQELRDNFLQSEAFSALFVELCTDAEAASAFANGIVPPNLDQIKSKIAANQAAVPQVPEAVETTDWTNRIITQREAREMDADELKARIAQGAVIGRD